ncbi:MAG: VOC family protein [Candidatus Eremiobacteraeota bacterium]|nr:VOC family protein [Candidatus Eremiobacteraeota bacterium]
MTASEQQITSGANALQLQPYIFFYGRCEEALEFYKNAFGGTYDAMRNSDSPVDEQVPADWGNKIMHASFTGNGVQFLCSDGREAQSIDPEEGNVSLALSASDGPTGERVFNALAQGGKITMPIDNAFWGGRFGSVQDKFGIEWLVTLP